MTAAAALPPGSPKPSTPSILLRSLSCWNWKCALLSAAARSIVYLTAMAHTGLRGSLAVVLVEMAYVTLTAGLYAGWQQQALGLRSRLLGNLTVAAGVPGLSQLLDWLAHRAVGPAAPPRATLAVCIFAALSALFHLYVMRRGAFLTGRAGRSLLDDFRRMPRLIAGFVSAPALFWIAQIARLTRTTPAMNQAVTE
jgi:hypothetical protein